MTKRQALQLQMTEWIWSLNADQKTEILMYLCAQSPRSVADAKYIYERMWAGATAQEEDQEED